MNKENERQKDLEKSNLVFVYGTLKKGFGNNGLLRDAEFIGESLVDNMTLYDMGFPVAVDRDGEKIKGEVFRITDELQSLDYLEGYPDFYDRKLVDTKHGQAWIYFQPVENVYKLKLKCIGKEWIGYEHN